MQIMCKGVLSLGCIPGTSAGCSEYVKVRSQSSMSACLSSGFTAAAKRASPKHMLQSPSGSEPVLRKRSGTTTCVEYETEQSCAVSDH